MSTAASIPWFLYAYKVTVTHNGEEFTLTDSRWEPEALRCEFTVEQNPSRAWWTADVSVYNLNTATEQALLAPGQSQNVASVNTPIVQGDLVRIFAGYKANFSPDASLIFEGTVFQPTWERVGVIDFKLTLRCIINNLSLKFISLTTGPFQTQAQIIAKMAAEANVPIEHIDTEALSQTAAPYGQSFFGTAEDVISRIAGANKMAFWVSPRGLNVRTLQFNSNTTPDIVYGPAFPANITVHPKFAALYSPTLLGTPQQTQEGVVFRVLMDARLKIASIVQLDMSAIRQLPVIPGGTPPSILDQDGLYAVCAIKHYGDTRGMGSGQWYSEVTALTYNYWSQWAPTVQQNLASQ